jgi:hypothetical protein
VLFAVSAPRSLGEGGHGTNFIAFWRGRGTRLITGREIVPVDEVGKGHWRSVAVEVVSEAENCQGVEFLLRAAVRVRVYLHYKSVIGAGVKAKTVTTSRCKGRLVPSNGKSSRVAGNKLPILTVLGLGLFLST